MKKKFLSILLALCILLVPTLLVACEESGTETPSDSDITDLPDANVEVTVEEYPSLSYDTSTEKVTDESIAKGTLTVSYDQSETLTLWVAEDSIVTAANGTTYTANGLRYNSYDLTATDAGEYSLYFVTEDDELAATYNWTVASAYPERVRFPALNFSTGTGGANAHDPSIIEADGVYYTFGTDNYGRYGYTIRRSTDLINWEYVGVAIEGYNESGSQPSDSNMPTGSNELYPIYQIISSDPNWGTKGAGDNKGNNWTLWAPNVVEAADGGYWLYACWTADFGQGHSIIFQCYSDTIEGPYELVYLDSAGTPSTSESDTPAVILYSYDGWSAGPNALDPFIYYDTEGNMYMAYGSFNAAYGIWALELDPETGLRKDGLKGAELLSGSTIPAAQRYGAPLVANNTEGPTISYHTDVEISSYDGTGSYDASASIYEDRYYLMTSSNSLSYDYNMRSYYSTSATGSYRADNGGTGGSRVSGSFSWRTGADASAGHLGFMDWFAPGHNDMFRTDEGDNMLVFHVRTQFMGADDTANHFQAQTLYAFNSRGEIVMNPNRYAGERLRKVTAAEIYTLTDGAYSFAYVSDSVYVDSFNGGYAMEGLELREDGSIYFNDAEVGTWVLYGDNYALLNITTAISAATGGGSLSGKFYGVAFPAYIEKTRSGGISISCLSEDGQDCLYLNMDFPD